MMGLLDDIGQKEIKFIIINKAWNKKEVEDRLKIFGDINGELQWLKGKEIKITIIIQKKWKMLSLGERLETDRVRFEKDI